MTKKQPRKSLSRKTRFEVFKRDKFTCQYCGSSSPQAVLVVDHIKPVSKQGDDDILNLITSCFECNAGKSNRELSDDAVIQKRKAQLDDLQERREQIEMMLEWQKGLVGIDERALESVCEFWHSLIPNYDISESGQVKVKQMIRRFGLQETLESMRLSFEKYIEIGPDQIPTRVSVAKTFDYVGRICSVRQAQMEKPYLHDLFYICGILRNRLGSIDRHATLALLEKAVKAGADTDELKYMAKQAERWYWWEGDMGKLIAHLEKNGCGVGQ